MGTVLSLAMTSAFVPAATVSETETQETTVLEENSQPPAAPDGSAMPAGPDGQPPEKPDGMPGGPGGEGMPEGAGGAGGPGGAGMPGGAPGGMPGGQAGVDSYTAVNTYEEDAEVENEEIVSTGADENAVLVDGGANVTLKNVTVDRTSEDSQGGDASSFYGVGAAILAVDGTANVSGAAITTDANGGAGAFAYGDGTVCIFDSEIRTSKGASGGIHAAGGGTLYAWNLDVETQGQSSAAVRSDRGGGTMVVDGGSYTSNGTGSPAIYSTADISVHDALLTANGSEAICIEGLNAIRLYDCDLYGNMGDDSQNDNTWTVILYQSMSGDSEIGNSTFQMDGGTLTSANGGVFYTTNTESTFVLRDVEITAAEDSEFFLQCTGNSNQRGWGTAGANGADCTFTGIEQEMNGDIVWDSISILDLYLTEGSTLTGAVINDESWAGNGGDGCCNLFLSEDSVWTVTGDSTLTSLYMEGTILDEEGNAVSIVGTDGTVYAEGDSEYTVTVENFEETADFSGASSVDEWADHEVTQA